MSINVHGTAETHRLAAPGPDSSFEVGLRPYLEVHGTEKVQRYDKYLHWAHKIYTYSHLVSNPRFRV